MHTSDFLKYNKYPKLDLRFKLKKNVISLGRSREALGSPCCLLLVFVVIESGTLFSLIGSIFAQWKQS